MADDIRTAYARASAEADREFPPFVPIMATQTVTAPALRSRCPRCQQVEAITIATLKQGVVYVSGDVSEEIVGYRYACQHCETVYSFGRNGAFFHDKRSQPLTPEVPRAYVEREDAPDPKGVLPPGFQRPVPKERPRV